MSCRMPEPVTLGQMTIELLGQRESHIHHRNGVLASLEPARRLFIASAEVMDAVPGAPAAQQRALAEIYAVRVEQYRDGMAAATKAVDSMRKLASLAYREHDNAMTAMHAMTFAWRQTYR